MSFAEALAAEMDLARKGPPCSIGALEHALDVEDWQALCASLDTVTIPTARIAGALNRRGVKVTPQTVSRHRKRLCACRPLAADE